MSVTIAIWGHYHGRNLGDEVVVEAIKENLRARVPQARIVGISLSPADTTARHRIEAFPLRSAVAGPAADDADDADAAPGPVALWKERLAAQPSVIYHAARAALRTARATRDLVTRAVAEPGFRRRARHLLQDLDLVVVAGSGPISDDWKGAWSHPFTVGKWTNLARKAGVPFAFLAVGAGPVDHWTSRRLLRRALSDAVFVSVRDESSVAVMERLGVPDAEAVPDLAFSLPPSLVGDGQPLGRANDDRIVVGLNPIPYYDGRYWPDDDPTKYAAHLEVAAHFAEWVLRSGRGLRLFGSQTHSDPLVCDDLVDLLRSRLPAEVVDTVERPPVHSVANLIDVLRSCDVVVAGRFHCILLPHLIGRPAVGMAYHPKTTALMTYLGREQSCFDIDEVTGDDLVEACRSLERDPDAVIAAVAARLPALRARLAAQYDALLSQAGIAVTPGLN